MQSWIAFLLAVSALALAGGDASPPQQAPARPSIDVPVAIGVNLSAPVYWSPCLPFIDGWRTSGPWGSQPTELPLALDARGWVRSLHFGQVARTVVHQAIPEGRYPPGTYVVRYQGKGKLVYKGDPRRVVTASGPGRDVLEVPTATRDGFLIELHETDPADPIRDLRVIPPGGVCDNDPLRGCSSGSDCPEDGRCEPFEQVHESQIFRPKFLERLHDYRVIRFMDWMDTNAAVLESWTDRPRVSDKDWFAELSGRHGGVPVEIMVSLANRLDADPWFTLPHRATDEFVTSFATYVRDHLKPGRKAYVEYSNEVWNAAFAQNRYAREQGRRLGLSPKDEWLGGARFYARRSKEIFQIWEAVFGGSERLVRVLASQSANAWLSERILEWDDAHEHADALAIAPYFGRFVTDPANQDTVRGWNLERFMDYLAQQELQAPLREVASQKQVAVAHGLDLIAYEGGQHLAGGGALRHDPKVNALYDAAQRHPRMKQIYLEYLSEWKRLGGGVFVHYSDCSGWNEFGRWGALEYIDQPRREAPKYDALQSFLESQGLAR